MRKIMILTMHVVTLGMKQRLKRDKKRQVENSEIYMTLITIGKLVKNRSEENIQSILPKAQISLFYNSNMELCCKISESPFNYTGALISYRTPSFI